MCATRRRQKQKWKQGKRVSIFHLAAQVIGRSSGRSATAAAAYRAAARIEDERTGEVFDFTRKCGVHETFILAPDAAPDWMRDRSQLWNAVEAAEGRKDAQLAREIEVSLPFELSHEQRRAVLLEFIHDEFTSLGMVADCAMHAPGNQGDKRNEHAHIMLTLRHVEVDGFGNKAREWNNRELVEKWRESWARRVNAALEKHGIEARVDHRSFERQAKASGDELLQAPLGTVHLGAHASAMERRGVHTAPGDINREVRIYNLEWERAKRTSPESLRAAELRQAAALSKLQALNRKRAEIEAAGWAIRQQARQYTAAMSWRRGNPFWTFLHVLGLVRSEAATLPATRTELQAQWDKLRQEHKQLEQPIRAAQTKLESARTEHYRLHALVVDLREGVGEKPSTVPLRPIIETPAPINDAPDARHALPEGTQTKQERPKPRLRSRGHAPGLG
jgi:hypothetical protein